jgi:hypothetical protein
MAYDGTQIGWLYAADVRAAALMALVRRCSLLAVN